MSDVRVRETFTVDGPTLDWFVRETNIIDEREELASAVRVALGTDGLADRGSSLPDPDSTDLRGWWGDMDAADIWGGWPIGCKNWLLARAKITDATASGGSTVLRAQQYTIDALQPLIRNRIASRIEVEATRTDLQTIEVNATIYRGPMAEIDLRYQILWEEDEAYEPVPVAGINRIIRVPYRNVILTSTVPQLKKIIPQTNLALSSTPPISVSSVPPIMMSPFAAQFVLSPTAVTAVGGTLMLSPPEDQLKLSPTTPTRSP